MTKALIVIDIQQAFLHPSWGERNNPLAEENGQALLKKWRKSSLPIIHIQHTSEKKESLFYRGSEGHSFKEGFEPLEGEPVFQKYVNSAFIGTELKDYLGKLQIKELVIFGLTTPHCVSTTVRMAGNFGFQVELVEDATAAFERQGLKGEHYSAEQIHQTELAILSNEFATIVYTDELLKK
jgi:nicotinamidase-related amidase